MVAQDENSFAVSFPLPFRVLFLVGLGILGWATNLHGLERLGIDGPGILELQGPNGLPIRSNNPPRTKRPTAASAYYAPIYQLFLTYSSWCFGAWLLYRTSTNSNAALVDDFSYIPGVCILNVLTVLLCTLNVVQKRQRESFLFAAERCFFTAANSPIHFSDVIFADIMTSYAKVLGDVWLSLWMLLPSGSMLSIPSHEGWLQWILPSLMSLPYMIRLRQCLIEYRSPTNTSRRPLLNAIKYASSFPVIFLSAAQRLVVSELVETHGEAARERAWHGEHPLFRLWLLAAVVNSLYSFWWDLTNDWGLEILQPRGVGPSSRSSKAFGRPSSYQEGLSGDESSSHPDGLLTPRTLSTTSRSHVPLAYPYGLRPVLLYPLPVYPLIIFLNLVLRMTWSIKLSSHLHLHSEGSAVIFWLEVAEVFRRWMWVFLRIEWELVRKGENDGFDIEVIK
ncbi:EXS-domain-containing protein [Scleroderma citrinum]